MGFMKKKLTRYVFPGQKPDKILHFPYDGEQLYEGLPIYEFYFDEPVFIVGTFLATAYSLTDSSLMPSVHTVNGCSRGYRCVYYLNNGKVFSWNTTYSSFGNTCNPQYSGSFQVEGCPLPEVNEELTSIIIPNIYPIIVPEGTTQLPEVDKGSRALQLNPNPAQGQVSVIAQEGVRLIEVADMSGRVLLQKPFDGMEESVVLDISRLPVGTYIVKVATNHTTATGKLVVE